MFIQEQARDQKESSPVKAAQFEHKSIHKKKKKGNHMKYSAQPERIPDAECLRNGKESKFFIKCPVLQCIQYIESRKPEYNRTCEHKNTAIQAPIGAADMAIPRKK
jgi:hypothetical protein